MVRVATFGYKFKGMRKPDDIIVYPRRGEEEFTFQGSRLIGTVNPLTKKGMLNFKDSNAKYFPHLSSFLGAEAYEYDQEFVNMVQEFQPKSGDLIGSSPITGNVYIN